MISITKREAKYMRDNGYEHFVKHTYAKYKNYFLVEDYKALNALNNYRRSVVVFSSLPEEPKKKKSHR